MEGIDFGLKPNSHFNTLTKIIGKLILNGLALCRRMWMFYVHRCVLMVSFYDYIVIRPTGFLKQMMIPMSLLKTFGIFSKTIIQVVLYTSDRDLYIMSTLIIQKGI